MYLQSEHKVWLATGETPVYLEPSMANRHGLIAGATGTGKTVTLKVLAESFSDMGVPVFLADIKGDLSGMVNERGGIVRAGTGSAMYYIFHANELGATADGRESGVPLPANYAPSLNIKLNGPVSLVKSFTKPNLSRVINGGPLTIEFSESVFTQDESITKVAQLVQLFVLRGGHQLQLNTVNRDRLLDAQQHPENYRNLVVRVAGYSALFTTLSRSLQDDIIARTEQGF